MKILVIGSGGREHVLVRALLASLAQSGVDTLELATDDGSLTRVIFYRPDIFRVWVGPGGGFSDPAGVDRLRLSASYSPDNALPSDERTLLSFKGIGPYTAGAIRSFAFGQRAAILDTNVARVLFRVFVGKGDPKRHDVRRRLWDLSRAVLPRARVFDFNQALMDFGALVCPARKPRCPTCPMRRSCAAWNQRP